MRIHTGFHRFTEIDHIFYNKYIFNNTEHFPSWKLANILSEWLGNPGKGTLRSKNPKNFLGEPAPRPRYYSVHVLNSQTCLNYGEYDWLGECSLPYLVNTIPSPGFLGCSPLVLLTSFSRYCKLRGSLPKSVPLDFGLEKTFAL